MKKRLLTVLISTAIIICSVSSLSFAAETKTATFNLIDADFQIEHPVTVDDGRSSLVITDGVINLSFTGDNVDDWEAIQYWNDADEYGEIACLIIQFNGSKAEITSASGYKITSVKFNLAPSKDLTYNYEHFLTFTTNYFKYPDGDVSDEEISKYFVAEANDEVVPLTLNMNEDYEAYVPAATDTVTKFAVSAGDDFDLAYLESVEVTYEPIASVGADTGDSNDIALYSIIAVIALAGAGVVYKRKEN